MFKGNNTPENLVPLYGNEVSRLYDVYEVSTDKFKTTPISWLKDKLNLEQGPETWLRYDNREDGVYVKARFSDDYETMISGFIPQEAIDINLQPLEQYVVPEYVNNSIVGKITNLLPSVREKRRLKIKEEAILQKKHITATAILNYVAAGGVLYARLDNEPETSEGIPDELLDYSFGSSDEDVLGVFFTGQSEVEKEHQNIGFVFDKYIVELTGNQKTLKLNHEELQGLADFLCLEPRCEESEAIDIREPKISNIESLNVQSHNVDDSALVT